MEPSLEKTEIRAALKSGVPLFHGLSEEGLDRAIGLARRDKCSRGETLFEQGDAAEAFHLVLAGRLKVSQTTADGQQVIIRYLGPREIAGCVAVCGGVPYPATAAAVEDTWLLTWSRPRIAELAARHPEIALNAMRIMGGRAVELQERLKELQTQRVERRVAHALGRLVVQAGRRTAEGIEIDFPITRQDLAEMTGPRSTRQPHPLRMGDRRHRREPATEGRHSAPARSRFDRRGPARGRQLSLFPSLAGSPLALAVAAGIARLPPSNDQLVVGTARGASSIGP